MNCPKCGSEMADGSAFCTKCGASLTDNAQPNFNFQQNGNQQADGVNAQNGMPNQQMGGMNGQNGNLGQQMGGMNGQNGNLGRQMGGMGGQNGTPNQQMGGMNAQNGNPGQQMGGMPYGNPNQQMNGMPQQNYYDPKDHTAEFDAKDISDNKVMAMLPYLLGTIGIIIALLASRESAYTYFHVRQALKITVVSVLIGIITVLLCWTIVVPIAGGVCGIILLVVRIICFFQICTGKAKEAPIVSGLGFLN